MTREQLEHAIWAACDVSQDHELFVFGSQAILAEHPRAPERLRASIEVDVQPRNRPEATEAIDGSLGELSRFHQTHGFYVHGVSIESATLPRGWVDRTIPVSDPVGTHGNVGFCVETHDLAASKLVADRDKDRDFVRTLLAEHMISPQVLLDRIRELDIGPERRSLLEEWVLITSGEIGQAPPRKLAEPEKFLP
jgi:hypothetical protein